MKKDSKSELEGKKIVGDKRFLYKNIWYLKHNILWFNVGELVEIVVGIWYSLCRKSVVYGPAEMVEISVS